MFGTFLLNFVWGLGGQKWFHDVPGTSGIEVALFCYFLGKCWGQGRAGLGPKPGPGPQWAGPDPGRIWTRARVRPVPGPGWTWALGRATPESKPSPNPCPGRPGPSWTRAMVDGVVQAVKWEVEWGKLRGMGRGAYAGGGAFKQGHQNNKKQWSQTYNN